MNVQDFFNQDKIIADKNIKELKSTINKVN